jgi:cytochrome c oxidase cbb3-type subunit 3
MRTIVLFSLLPLALAAQGGRGRGQAAADTGTLRFCPGSGIPCVEITREAYERGHQQFIQSCGFCHGRNAAGGTGPNLIYSGVVRHDTNGADIAKVIRQGRPGPGGAPGMPPVNVSEAQMNEIVAYVRARVAEADKTSSRRPGRDYELSKLLTGNAELGKAYFNGAGQCAGCHSPTGDLRGVAAKYSPIELQAKLLYPAGKRPAATVTDATGHKFTGDLLENTAFDVAIRDAGGWYRSWPAGSVKLEISDPLAKHLELLSHFTTADMHNVFAYLETLK